jgi:hypothetical protein
LGIGRRTRPLGPLQVDIAAPRERVFAAAVEILERAGQMVLAAHRTVVGPV